MRSNEAGRWVGGERKREGEVERVAACVKICLFADTTQFLVVFCTPHSSVFLLAVDRALAGKFSFELESLLTARRKCRKTTE